MVYFIGAGPGAVDLITVRGAEILKRADVVIYAGSLVNKDLLEYCKKDAIILNSASMTLEEICAVYREHGRDKTIARLQTGDTSLYGAIREQMDALEEMNIEYETVPGVSSMNAAAAVLNAEYTLSGVSQTLIATRMAGRTEVPDKESIKSLAAHGASMALFLSAGMLEELCKELISGGYGENTPAAVVYKATWPDEKIIISTLKELPGKAKDIKKTALVLVGDFLSGAGKRSRLYDPKFTHGFREAKE